MEKTELLKKIIGASENICVFTGAGISCPSGIPDFRSSNGLYNRKNDYKYRPEEIISHSFFERQPEIFYRFYKSAMLYPEAKPNEAHKYFASLERTKNVTVVTQNIDGLHQKGGSSHVIELHGSVYRNYCTHCGKFYDISYIEKSKGIPLCEDDNAIIKPDVVLYEEPLDEKNVENAIKCIKSADTLIITCTSLAVYPAASFVRFFNGNNLVLINKEKTLFDGLANLTIYDDIINVIRTLKLHSA